MLGVVFDPSGATDARHLRAKFPAELSVIGAGALVAIQDSNGGWAGAEGGCLVEGSVFNLQKLAEELGLDPELSPAQLLFHAYQRWGVMLPERLKGVFSLVAWDAEARHVLLAGDQTGVHCWFVRRTGGGLTASSEVHSLLRMLGSTPPPDEVAVLRGLTMASLEEGRTQYAGVRRLGNGRLIAIRDGRIEESYYWRPPYREPLEGSHLDVAAELRAGLIGAVRRRIEGVERVGLMMSGGFDSSAVCGSAVAASEQPDVPLHGYSAVFPGDARMDEGPLLDALAGELPIVNVRHEISPGGIAAIALDYMRDWALPLSGPGWAIEYSLTRRAAADGMQILLDGQGGDELFGVAPYLFADRLAAGRVLWALDFARRRTPLSQGRLPWRYALEWLRVYGFSGLLSPNLHSRFTGGGGGAPPHLNDTAACQLHARRDELGWARDGDGPRWWMHMRWVLTEARESSELADFTRRRAAWAGIEARPPMFDPDLVELALRIPPEMRFDPFLDRPIGREAVSGLVPDSVRLSRRKSNLAPFYFRGIANADIAFVREILGGERREIDAWVRPEVVRSMVATPPREGAEGWMHWLSQVWSCFATECWLRWLANPEFADSSAQRHDLRLPAYRESVVSQVVAPPLI